MDQCVADGGSSGGNVLLQLHGDLAGPALTLTPEIQMTAHINVARSRSLRSAGVLYDVTIDGEAVGRLKRGQTISHAVKPGTHDVKALFAKTGWQVPDPKTSPTMTYTVQDDQTLVLNVSLGPANSPGMTTPTKEDWLRLTAPGEAAGTAQGSTTAIVRVLLAVIVLGGFVMSLVSHAGSLGHTVGQVVMAVAAFTLAYSLYQHFRRAV